VAVDDASLVTIADREHEQLIQGAIEGEFAEGAILGEEGPSGRPWIIDPIDGTRDFVRGNRVEVWDVAPLRVIVEEAAFFAMDDRKSGIACAPGLVASVRQAFGI
jgi:fructose-1,6-bisphosphatase/inositol monophosphatase family enzyme